MSSLNCLFLVSTVFLISTQRVLPYIMKMMSPIMARNWIPLRVKILVQFSKSEVIPPYQKVSMEVCGVKLSL